MRVSSFFRRAVLAAATAAAFALQGCLAEAEEGGEGNPRVTSVSDAGWTPTKPTAPKGWPALRWPEDNPWSAEKAVLGRRLFFEKALSRDRSVSCASCHAPASAFADSGKARSTGVFGLPSKRNAPTLANLGFAPLFMFEGGVPTLEMQALAPLFDPHEMDMTGTEIEARLAGDTLYARLFARAYGDTLATLARVTKALATYQRSLVSSGSRFDRWQAGDANALTAAEKRGADLFLGEKADCWHCHAPPLFTNHDFHNLGLDSVIADLGRALVTGRAADEGKFKTPTLRNVALTAPYMRDGRFATLREVIDHYNAGKVPHANTDALMRPLGLSEGEMQDLAAFLGALTDPAFLASPAPPPR